MIDRLGPHAFRAAVEAVAHTENAATRAARAQAEPVRHNAEVERENAEISDDTALMMRGYEAGKAWAEALKVGDDFRGTMGEARHRGLSGFELEGFGIGAFEIVNTLKLWTRHDTLTIVRLER